MSVVPLDLLGMFFLGFFFAAFISYILVYFRSSKRAEKLVKRARSDRIRNAVECGQRCFKVAIHKRGACFFLGVSYRVRFRSLLGSCSCELKDIEIRRTSFDRESLSAEFKNLLWRTGFHLDPQSPVIEMFISFYERQLDFDRIILKLDVAEVGDGRHLLNSSQYEFSVQGQLDESSSRTDVIAPTDDGHI